MNKNKLPSLKEILKFMEERNVKEIAQNLNIKGRRDMTLMELRRSVYNWLIKGENIENILRNLPASAIEMIDIICDSDGVIKKDLLYKKFGKNRHTFRKYLSYIQKHGIAYLYGDSIIIPKQIYEITKSSIQEKEEKMSFSDFLLMYLSREELKSICKKFMLPISGNKRELVERIVKAHNSPPPKMY